MIVLVALSLAGLKLNRFAAAPPPYDGVVARQITAFLAARRFEVQKADPAVDAIWYKATAGSCRVEVREVSSQGWDRAKISVLFGDDRVVYVYGGRQYAEQPAWITWSYYHLRRVAGLVGWQMPNKAVLAVAQSSACSAHEFDWAQMT